MTLGFIVGKFYPPHRGHKHLIDTARRQVDRLIVMIADHPSQTIPGELRQAWLEEIHPDCEIHLVPDELEDDSRPVGRVHRPLSWPAAGCGVHERGLRA